MHEQNGRFKSIKSAQRVNEKNACQVRIIKIMTNNQSKCFEKLGIGLEDVKMAERLLNQIPPCPSDSNNKVEQLMGYATTRLLREKAIRVLGTTELEVELENAKNLGSLGVGGRRRSWATSEHLDGLEYRKSEYCPNPPLIILRRRRRNTFSSPRRRIEGRSFGRSLQSQFNV